MKLGLVILLGSAQSSLLQKAINKDGALPLINPIDVIGKDCFLPTDFNLQHVRIPGGWATEDQKCRSGMWCPYACLPGMYSRQWDPAVKCADPNHCGSTHGGLFCNNGKLNIPFRDQPLCVRGLPAVGIVNKASKPVSVCQTVYPGSEIMLIATSITVGSTQELTTPHKTNWQSAGAHFYTNMLGSSREDCRWGDQYNPVGNWGPYVIGTSHGFEQNVYLRVAPNPNYLSSFPGINPGYTLGIQCHYGECINAPCRLGNGQEECVVTIKPGAKAYVVIYNN